MREIALCDVIPERFAEVGKMKELSMAEKLELFYTLKYPESTWFYHNVIGIDESKQIDKSERIKFIKHLCENDLYYFAKYILKKDKLRELPNRIMAEKIMIRKQPGNQERKLICEPRGTFKTTLGSIAFPIWSMCKDPNISIQIDSETDRQAHTIYGVVRDELDFNMLLKEMYGEFKTERWNETFFNIKQRKIFSRDPTMFHSGVDSSNNGFHPDIIIVDDPCSEINTQTDEQVEKICNHVRTLTPLLEKDGEMIFILTRWRVNDLGERLIKNESETFSIISVKSCYGEDGNGKSREEGLYAPEILTDDFLNKAKKSMGMYLFSANYLNDPKPDADKSFKMEWLRYYEGDEPMVMGVDGEITQMPLSVYMAMDASWADQASTSGKDPTAIVVIGFDDEGDSYLLDVFNKRISPTEVIEKVFQMVSIWNPIRFATEDVGTQKGLNLQIEEEMHKRQIFFPMDRVKHQARGKENRIMSLTPIFEQGTFYINNKMDEFKDQYLYFNPVVKLAHDDILDAIEMLEFEYREVHKQPTDEGEVYYDEEMFVCDRRTGRM